MSCNVLVIWMNWQNRKRVIKDWKVTIRQPGLLLLHTLWVWILDCSNIYIEIYNEEPTQKLLLGLCNTSSLPLLVSLWWAQLWDGTGSVSFPVGQQGTVDTYIPHPTPSPWQAKTEGFDALHLGCPNASSEALEPGSCFSTQILLWPKLKQSPSSSSSPPKAIRLLHPPCSQQKAEGRGKAWHCGTPPAGNDPLCASAETPTWQRRL